MGYNDRCAALADCDEVRISGLWGCVCVYVMKSTSNCMEACLLLFLMIVQDVPYSKSALQKEICLWGMCTACYFKCSYACSYPCVLYECDCDGVHKCVWRVFVTVKIMLLLLSFMLLLLWTKSITMTNPESSCVSCVHAHRHKPRTVKILLSLLKPAVLIFLLLKLLFGVCNSFCLLLPPLTAQQMCLVFFKANVKLHFKNIC